MKDIREMLVQRDKFHLDATNSIALEIQFVFNAILQFMEEEVDNVEWHAMEHSSDEDAIMFSARVKQRNGFTLFSVGVPLTIILQGSAEVIVAFLEKTSREDRAQKEAAEADARNNLTSRVRQAIEGDENAITMVPITKNNEDIPELTGADVLREVYSKKRTLH